EDMQRHLNLREGALSHRKILPDRELVRHASGGLALQGIYKTSDQRCLLEKQEELLCVPKEFVLRGPNQDRSEGIYIFLRRIHVHSDCRE
ncbi:hypothetical protein ACJELQ_26610, partial [Escherichia coli]